MGFNRTYRQIKNTLKLKTDLFTLKDVQNISNDVADLKINYQNINSNQQKKINLLENKLEKLQSKCVISKLNNKTIKHKAEILDALSGLEISSVKPLIRTVNKISETDLPAILQSIKEIKETDLDPVLKAIKGIPKTDLSGVMQAIADIPKTDLTEVLLAITNIPPTDLSGVLTAIESIPKADLSGVLSAIENISVAEDLSAANASLLTNIKTETNNLSSKIDALTGEIPNNLSNKIDSISNAVTTDLSSKLDTITGLVSCNDDLTTFESAVVLVENKFLEYVIPATGLYDLGISEYEAHIEPLIDAAYSLIPRDGSDINCPDTQCQSYVQRLRAVERLAIETNLIEY